MKKIAIVTGASSGIGRRFAETVSAEFPETEELWVIARRKERLEELRDRMSLPVKVLSMDLTDRANYDAIAQLLEEEKPDVRILVNASGYGFFDSTAGRPLQDNLNMMDLDCGAVMAMCQMTIPYMHSGAKILNIASVAAFQPIPYINVYAACKTFCLYYSRALNRELKKQGISVTALCPFWTDTEFFDRAIIDRDHPIVKKYVVMLKPDDIVKRGWRDLKVGKDISKFGFAARLQTSPAKILPHSLVMNIWMRQQGLD